MRCLRDHPQSSLSGAAHYSSKGNRQSGSPFQAEQRVPFHLSHNESLQEVTEVCVSRGQAEELAQLFEGITQTASITLHHMKHAAFAAIPELKSCIALDAAGDSRPARLESQAVQNI